ncbi:hypothetical protein TNCV_3579711 [Trichonephila clavipes]|nr:hypothetical protein TNCV_3579711 [Trichonephila clavipes]
MNETTQQEKTTQPSSAGTKQLSTLHCPPTACNRPLNLENQRQCRRITTQLVSTNETTQLNRRKTSTRQHERNNSTGENNSTRLSSNETTPTSR